MPKPKNSADPAKPETRPKARVLANASIRDFVEAVLRNINEEYWQLAEPLLDGSVPEGKYAAHAAALESLKRAGEIVQKTLAEDNDDDDSDAIGDEQKIGQRQNKRRRA